MSDLVDRYLACWNETDAHARRALVAQTFTTDVTYVDPMLEVAGADALSNAIGAVHAQFPGLVFAASGSVDAHHAQARFGWSLGPAGEEPPVLGFDVVVTDPDGRIRTVLGFLDRLPGGVA